MASPKAAALLLVLFAAVTAPLRVQGTAYRITPSGAQGGAAPNDYGVGSGFGNEESSSWQWLRYLNPTSVRLFVQPLTNNWNWIKFVGNQYGLSFKQVPVVDQASWQAAVEQERSISDAPDKPNYFTWLQDNSPIKWSQILTNLNTTQTGAYGAQRGNPQYVLLQLQRRGYAVSSLWDVRCTNLDLATDNPDDAEYWKRRWEMYRCALSKKRVPLCQHSRHEHILPFDPVCPGRSKLMLLPACVSSTCRILGSYGMLR